jgi:hypothetical protein
MESSCEERDTGATALFIQARRLRRVLGDVTRARGGVLGGAERVELADLDLRTPADHAPLRGAKPGSRPPGSSGAGESTGTCRAVVSVVSISSCAHGERQAPRARRPRSRRRGGARSGSAERRDAGTQPHSRRTRAHGPLQVDARGLHLGFSLVACRERWKVSVSMMLGIGIVIHCSRGRSR